MATKNINEEIDDCLCNVSNEAYRVQHTGGNLNAVKDSHYERELKQNSKPLKKQRRLSVDQQFVPVSQRFTKQHSTRRASCSPYFSYSPQGPNQKVVFTSRLSDGLPGRRHSHAGISQHSMSEGNFDGFTVPKYRKQSLKYPSEVKCHAYHTPHLSGDIQESRSGMKLQVVSESVPSNDGGRHKSRSDKNLTADLSISPYIPVSTSRDRDHISNTNKVSDALLCLESLTHSSIAPADTGIMASNFAENENTLPKSVSFARAEELQSNTLQATKSKSLSLDLFPSTKQRRKAVSYTSDNHPVFEVKSGDNMKDLNVTSNLMDGLKTCLVDSRLNEEWQKSFSDECENWTEKNQTNLYLNSFHHMSSSLPCSGPQQDLLVSFSSWWMVWLIYLQCLLFLMRLRQVASSH